MKNDRVMFDARCTECRPDVVDIVVVIVGNLLYRFLIHTSGWLHTVCTLQI